MAPTGPAAVHLADEAQRALALSVLGERGYTAAPVDAAGALAAVAGGAVVVVELDGIQPDALRAARAAVPIERAGPLLVVLDAGDAAAVHGALMAGAAGLVPRRFDAATLHLQVAAAECWVAERASSKRLIDALPDMVFRMTEDGTFLDFHAESIDALAVPPDQIVGRRASSVLGDELGAKIADATARALATGATQRFEYGFDMPNGPHDYEARIVASGPSEVVAIVRDMTEPKVMQARLAVADRLAALGTLSAGVAHEINNPLTYVLIGIESVLKELRRAGDEGPSPARVPVYIERLEGAVEGARRVRRIVTDLRTFGRPDETDENARPVDVRAVLDSAAAMVDSEIRYRARVIREYRDVPMVLVSPDRLAQVFVNLLLNATQAMPDGDAAGAFIRLRTDRDARGRVVIEIEDSGPGIAPEDLDRIFDPFFTTKPVGVGTGLGLWICHSIITSYGGDITAQGRAGEGATFRIVLPAAPEVTAAPEPDDEVAMPDGIGRVLVIDDDPQVTKALAILLDGADISVATSGPQALERLAREEFTWIFCDLMMPGLSGMEVYEQVRRAGRGVEKRFVFMTGGAFTPRAREFVARVPNPCLSKPFHARQLAAILRGPGRRPR
ncbi:MAG TPA: ATP-binding protein [Kofleriaceae bacterium]|nr:ATP-binding protein [Kofleriaceae bacterium]